MSVILGYVWVTVQQHQAHPQGTARAGHSSHTRKSEQGKQGENRELFLALQCWKRKPAGSSAGTSPRRKFPQHQDMTHENWTSAFPRAFGSRTQLAGWPSCPSSLQMFFLFIFHVHPGMREKFGATPAGQLLVAATWGSFSGETRRQRRGEEVCHRQPAST